MNVADDNVGHCEGDNLRGTSCYVLDSNYMHRVKHPKFKKKKKKCTGGLTLPTTPTPSHHTRPFSTALSTVASSSVHISESGHMQTSCLQTSHRGAFCG